MSKEEAEIINGLKKIAYLRKERLIMICIIWPALAAAAFYFLPGNDDISPSFLVIVVALITPTLFNTIRFGLIKCPRCHKPFNGYAYILGIRRGNALECRHCGLSLSELPEFKPTYKPGGQDQW